MTGDMAFYYRVIFKRQIIEVQMKNKEWIYLVIAFQSVFYVADKF